MLIRKSSKGQAMPELVCPIEGSAFDHISHTEIRWLGNAGVMINCRGTVLMIDPILKDFDMPLLFDIPIRVQDVPRVDGVLITHIDSDHFSRATCKGLKEVCQSFHTTKYVASVMKEEEIDGTGHDIGDRFELGAVQIQLTKVEHTWQNERPEFAFRKWKAEDYCGFWIDTPDGSIWMPGDSRLMDEHLHMPKTPDVILFDFSEDDWHITLKGAIELANAYPKAKLLCIHWGTIDAPEFAPFNGNPENLLGVVNDDSRVMVLNPGEAFKI